MNPIFGRLSIGWQLLFHFIIFAIFAFDITYHDYYFNIPGGRGYGGKWKYLTVWDVLVQCVFFMVCCFDDVTMLISRHDRPLKKASDNFFSCLAFPLGVFVSVSFWILYTLDNELVIPADVAPYYPLWLNHLDHSGPIVVMLAEAYLCYHQYPSKAFGLTLISLFALVYLMWVLYLAWAAGIWVYPFLDKFSAIERATFITGSVFVFWFFYLSGHLMNSLLWRKRAGEEVDDNEDGPGAKDEHEPNPNTDNVPLQ
ncbi:unnamed protein product [Darwinula stevensoni]|uniref:Uncharacterized protein n=1 Tax=Darwinula stevensoni TaxID=69355 RepID=A0A7R8X5F1_9CRUS|nr:unnamed protein product [Darwinula stevensoni]CAG0880368.1 unnamed protein product [Darwinula stevensoni]